jgi:DNA-binding CsgD family transcriptional regulator
MARMLDIVDYGLLLVADDGRVAYANEVARAELAHGHPLHIEAGVLTARRAADATALRQALHGATRRSAQSLLTVGDAGGGRVGVSVVPLGEPGELPTTLLVLGKRQACEELSRDAFARQHALTLAETRVLKGLCGGAKPAEIARSCGVKLTTVRTQIGSIRLKTGARDIGEIVQEVSRLPPLPCLMRRAA